MPGKTVAQKLLIKEGYVVLLIDPPVGYLPALQAQCPEAKVSEKIAGGADLVQLFVSSESQLKKNLPRMKMFLRPRGLLWVTYPKRTSRLGADINRDIIREYAETIDLQTVSLVAVDDVWSALRLKSV